MIRVCGLVGGGMVLGLALLVVTAAVVTQFADANLLK